MQYWEKRYGRMNSGPAAVEHTRIDRVKNLAIILMAVMLIGTCIVSIQALSFRRDCGETFVTRMKIECSTALSHANYLSRSGGSDSAVVLGKIRASLRAIESINDMQRTLTGSMYVDSVVFTELYEIIDSYSAKLKTASSTIQEQTNLGNHLPVLQNALSGL